KFADGVVGAADFERPDRLLVLELEVRAQLLDVEKLRSARDPPQAVCGFLNVPGSDHATFWASGLGTWVWAWPWTSAREASLVVLLDIRLFIFLHDARHIHDQVAGGEVHDLHPLGVTARNPDSFDGHADHDPLLGDHHQLVTRQHLFEGNDVAG